ncbi:hypothetical protein HMPREF9120_01057 [Neisseria sp. oral taxon 020 str. F0370]|nr:hypothetical protein HMPREF9120_01057 [Neisseria sp. oral taxon 020 str. F0370]
MRTGGQSHCVSFKKSRQYTAKPPTVSDHSFQTASLARRRRACYPAAVSPLLRRP